MLIHLSLCLGCSASGLPAGAILIEAESFERCEWHIVDKPEASGALWAQGNQPDWICETQVQLPAGEYSTWVRCADNGHYPNHYHFRVTLNEQEYWAGTSEPLSRRVVWERLGTVTGGPVTIRLDQADSWTSACDALMFVPDPLCRPSGPPDLALLGVESALGRRSGRVDVEFEGPTAADGECWVGLRGERGFEWLCRATPAEMGAAGPGRLRYRVSVETPALRFVPPGTYALTLEWGEHQWIGREEGDQQVAEVELGPTLTPRPAQARVRTARGEPELLVNGRPLFPFAFLGVHRGRYGEFGEQGCHLYSVPCGLGNLEEGVFDPTEPDSCAQDVLRQNARALILFRVQLEPPEAWLTAHPTERVVFDDGSVGPQSFASRRWLDRITGDLRRFVEHVRGSSYADRVIGLHLCTGYTAEWQSWGLWDNLRGDFSPAFARYFRHWLRERYGTDAALAAAWGQPGLTFGSARAPERSRRDSPTGLLWDPVQDRQILDFYEAYAQAAADAIEETCAAVKEASEGQLLAGVFYGYLPQYGELSAESQHLGLHQVLKSPHVDFLCAPAMYTDRGPGGVSAFMSLTDSIRLHGKLWLNESDIRTHLQDNEIGRCADWDQTQGVLKREYAAVRCRGAGQWWFDMSDGWFASPEIHSVFGEMNRLGQSAALARPRRYPEPEIAAVLSLRSALRAGAGPYGGFWFRSLTLQVPALDRIGAPSELYLVEDRPDLSSARLVLFLNAFDLTTEEREWIEGLKSEGRVLVFVYAAGIGEVSGPGVLRESTSAMESLIGQDLAPAERGPMRVELTGDPLCEGLRYEEPVFGMAATSYGLEGEYPERLAGPEAERVLGRFADGVPALTLRDMGSWVSVYNGSPGLPPGILRNLARLAGAHIYSDTDDALYAGRGVIALHARTAGPKAIQLPRQLRVRELLDGDGRERTTDRIEFDASAFETRVFEVDVP